MKKRTVATVRQILMGTRQSGIGLKRGNQDAILDDCDVIARIDDEYQAELARIDKDQNLTQVGKADAYRSAARKTTEVLEKWLAPKLAGLAANEAQAREALAKKSVRVRPTEVGAAISDAIVRSEIRRAAAGLDPLMRENLFRIGDPRVRDALLEAPAVTITPEGFASVQPFVSDKVRDELLLDTASRMDPENGATVHDCRKVREMFDICANTIRSAVREVTPERDWRADEMEAARQRREGGGEVTAYPPPGQ